MVPLLRTEKRGIRRLGVGCIRAAVLHGGLEPPPPRVRAACSATRAHEAGGADTGCRTRHASVRSTRCASGAVGVLFVVVQTRIERVPQPFQSRVSSDYTTRPSSTHQESNLALRNRRGLPPPDPMSVGLASARAAGGGLAPTRHQRDVTNHHHHESLDR